MAHELLPSGYAEFLADLKERIRNAQIRAALAVNSALVEFRWQIGQAIVEQQESAKWGDAVLDQLRHDLKRGFPDLKGFSRRNLYRMRAFYLAYREHPELVPQVVAHIPWGHNIVLLEKLKGLNIREWYARACIQHGWSRAILEAQIDTRLHQRQGAAPTSFERTLPAPQSELFAEALSRGSPSLRIYATGCRASGACAIRWSFCSSSSAPA